MNLLKQSDVVCITLMEQSNITWSVPAQWNKPRTVYFVLFISSVTAVVVILYNCIDYHNAYHSTIPYRR